MYNFVHVTAAVVQSSMCNWLYAGYMEILQKSDHGWRDYPTQLLWWGVPGLSAESGHWTALHLWLQGSIVTRNCGVNAACNWCYLHLPNHLFVWVLSGCFTEYSASYFSCCGQVRFARMNVQTSVSQHYNDLLIIWVIGDTPEKNLSPAKWYARLLNFMYMWQVCMLMHVQKCVWVYKKS